MKFLFDHDVPDDMAFALTALMQIANAFTTNWIPAFAGMTLLFDSWSVMPAQAGIQSLLSYLGSANAIRTEPRCLPLARSA